MKTTIALALCLIPLAVSPLLPQTSAAEDSLIDELAWMEGRWIIDGDGQYLEETWGPAREDAMVGSLRWARKHNVWLYELMSIEADEEHGLVFRLRHFNRNLEPWDSEKEGPLTYPLLDFSENRVVFENPERDSPRRFVYEREGDQLTIRIEDPEGNDESPFQFKLDS